MDLKTLEGSKVEKVLALQINPRKECHKMFKRYFPEQYAEQLIMEESKRQKELTNQTPQKLRGAENKIMKEQQMI